MTTEAAEPLPKWLREFERYAFWASDEWFVVAQAIHVDLRMVASIRPAGTSLSRRLGVDEAANVRLAGEALLLPVSVAALLRELDGWNDP